MYILLLNSSKTHKHYKKKNPQIKYNQQHTSLELLINSIWHLESERIREKKEKKIWNQREMRKSASRLDKTIDYIEETYVAL